MTTTDTPTQSRVQCGYTDTAIGPLPADWSVRRLGDLVALKTGPFGSLLHKSDYVRDGVPLVNPIHMSDGCILPDASTTVTVDAVVRLADFRLREGDVVVARRGEMGRSAVVRAEQDGWLCGTGSMILRPKDELDPIFLQRVFSSSAIVSRITDASVGSTMVSLNNSTLSGLLIQLPTYVEQRAIAAALSDVDELIGALGKLIAKKRSIKLATMQQLLTGDTRLPGFSGEWTRMNLAQAAYLRPGINKPTSEMGSGTLYVTVQDLYDGVSIVPEKLGRIRLSHAEIEAGALEEGDIIFGKSSVKRDGIGYPSQFLGAPEPVVCSGFTYRARPDRSIVDARYLFYWLRSSPVRRWLIDNSQASALTNINKAIADAIPVEAPSVPEQIAIASILCDMDAEIAALKRRRDKTKAIKQGMMQLLLTGRIRLVEPEGTP